MIKKTISAVCAFILTVAVTTSVYAKGDILNSISAGAAKKVSVSADSETKASGKMTVVSKTDADKKDSQKVSANEGDDVKKSGGKSKAGDSIDSESVSSDDSSEKEKSSVSEDAESKEEDPDNDRDAEDDEESSDDRGDTELCVADVENSMNVRAEATENSSVVGYLYKDSVGEILERRDGWTRVRSGDLEGWAKNDYLLFGDDAEKRTEGAIRNIAVISADRLRVRAEASEEADIKAMLSFGDEVEIIEKEGDEWTKISFEDGTSGEDTGYVSNDFITTKSSYKTGETVEQVKDREEKSKAAREEAEKADKEEKKSDIKSVENDSRKAEDIKISTEELESAAETKAETAVTNTGSVSASVDDETLLAALIQCECNGSYESQLAVGAVVVNRAKTGYGSISNAIYAPYQFGPASSGKLALTISSGAISATARQAAHDAISGISNVGGARYFRNVSSGHAGIVVGNHVYW